MRVWVAHGIESRGRDLLLAGVYATFEAARHAYEARSRQSLVWHRGIKPAVNRYAMLSDGAFVQVVRFDVQGGP